MATGNVVPGAPVTAEHTGAGRPDTGEQPDWAAQRFAAQGLAAQGFAAQGYAHAGYAAQGYAPGPLLTGHVPSAGLASALDASPAKQAPARRWRGAGGRWLVWVFRAVLWAVLLVIGYRGVAAIVTGYRTPSGQAGTTGAAASGRGHAFPATLATAYALEFGQAYLNFNPATAAQRASSLAAFVLPGTSPEFGWNGAGTQTLQSEQVAGIRVLARTWRWSCFWPG
jgi:hypothetical protein